jgi:quinol monooxygenase YgiN
MTTTVVTYIEVQPGRTSEAIKLLNDYCGSSPSGILALQEIHRKNRFVVIESWEDDAAFQARKGPDLREIHTCPNDQRVHTSFAVGAPQPPSPTALYLVTHVDVPPPRKDETEILLKRIAEQSPTHQGNLRYDVFQQHAPRTNHFTVVECWADENAFAAHETQTHTLQYREALGPMLGAPYDDRWYRHLKEG